MGWEGTCSGAGVGREGSDWSATLTNENRLTFQCIALDVGGQTGGIGLAQSRPFPLQHLGIWAHVKDTIKFQPQLVSHQ